LPAISKATNNKLAKPCRLRAREEVMAVGGLKKELGRLAGSK
jgi:hypothetical protein